MITKGCVAFAVVLLQIQHFRCAELPSNFKRCEFKNPKLNQCLAASTEAALRDLKSGSKELGIPSIEPIEIPVMVIGAGEGPVNMVQDLKNVLIHGVSSVMVTDFNIDLEKNIIKLTTFMSNLTFESDYVLSGRILTFPIQGQGHLVFAFTDTVFHHTLIAEEFLKKGNKHYKIVDYKMEIKPKKLHLYFDNLFNGDNALRDGILKVMNENWEVLFDDVHRFYDEAFEIVFKEYANRVFGKVPLKNIFIY